MFVELKSCDHHNGENITVNMLFFVYDIARVSEHPADRSRSLLRTRKGEHFLLAERFDDVARKIKQASKWGGNNG